MKLPEQIVIDEIILRPLAKWSGKYKNIPFSIHAWNISESLENLNWNYYLFLREKTFKKYFDSFWLEGKVVPPFNSYVNHDYYNSPLARIDFHGGITFYEKHGHVEGYRSIEVGCDYSHLWDHAQGLYEIQDILRDVKNSINSLLELFPVETNENNQKALTA